MPEHGEEQIYPIRLTEEFIEGLAQVWSPRVLSHIKGLIEILPQNPEIGSSRVRASLRRRFGENLRKLPVSTFVIVYRFDGRMVDVLALVYGPSIA